VKKLRSLLKYDIAVVGGGPAGLSAAYSAAKSGAKVILFEKEDAIAHSIRTSGVTWIEEMQKLDIPREFYNPIKNFSIISPSNEVTIKGNSFTSCVLNIRGMYQHLAALATEAGAEIMIRSNVEDVVFNSTNKICGLKVRTPRGNLTIESNLVIDASGFSSSIARKLGLAKPWKRYGVGAEYECYCERLDQETWVLMVGKEYSDAGYAWIFPLSNNRVRIGVGVGRPDSTADPLQKLNSMMEKKLKPLDTLGKIHPIELHYGFIPNDGLRHATVFDGLILVGDSAGQANPLVLEGIRYAIEFGRVAGDIGAKSLSKDSVKSSLYDYERICKNKIQSKINSAMKIQLRWMGLSDDQWDKEIEILRHMSIEEFLDFIRAEFTVSKMLRLAINHPKVAARQLFNTVLKT
jgi:digeranylgeranylglycerophospholipid reductase